MSSKLIIETVRNLVANDDLANALQILRNLLENSPKLDEAILQSARFNDIRRQIRLGTIEHTEAAVTQAKIRVGLLEILREIEEQNAKPAIRKELKSVLENQIQRSEYDYFRVSVQKYEHNQASTTSTPLVGKTVDQLDKKSLKKLFSQARVQTHLAIHSINKKTGVAEKLRALHLMPNGHVIKGTFLCLSNSDQIRSVSSNAYLSKFFVFEDTQGLRTKITEFVAGNLIGQFEQMILHIKRNLYLVRNIDTRTEDFEIPEIAFTEILANAFIHRNYGDHIITDVKVEIYPDRMEISNPGQFPEDIDVNHLEQNTKSFIKNPEIVQAFFLHNYAETAAKGIVRSQAVLKNAGLQPAVFVIKKGYVNVIIYKKPIVTLKEQPKQMRNVVGMAVRGNDFFPRPTVMNQIYRRLESGENVLLTGQRRSGKTSLFRAMADNPRPGFRFAYLNVSHIQDSMMFYSTLASNLANDGLDAESISYNTLVTLLSRIEVQSSEKGTLVILLDDFSWMLENILRNQGQAGVEAFLVQIQKLRLQHTKIRFVLTSETISMAQNAKSGALDLNSDLNFKDLPPLTHEEARMMLSVLLEQYQVNYSPNLIPYLLERLEWFMPFYLQMFAQELIDIFESKRQIIGEREVDEAFDRLVSLNGYNHFELFKSHLQNLLQEDELHFAQKTLHLLAKENALSTETIRNLANGLQPEKREHVMDCLESVGYVMFEKNQNVYRFQSPLIRTWWAKYDDGSY
jgi:uncharacterized protein